MGNLGDQPQCIENEIVEGFVELTNQFSLFCRLLKGRVPFEKITMYLEKFNFLQWVSHALFFLQPVSISKKDLDPLIVIPEKMTTT